MIRHAIDSVVYTDKTITILGWAFDDHGSPVEFLSNHLLSCLRIARYDVQAVFPDDTLSTEVGFEVVLKKKRFFNKKVINLILRGCKDEVVLEIPLHEKEIAVEEEKIEYKDFSYCPKISIVIPVYNTPLEYFEELITSILMQTYENWELCLADGGSSNQVFLERVTKLSEEDERIKFIFLGENLGISGNTNEAITISTGEFIAFCDHDDILHKDALYEIVNVLNEHLEADMIYTDEDKINMDSTQHFQPNRKSDFNMRLLEVGNYLNHLTVVRAELLLRIGGLRTKFDGSQDYDVVLRISEKTDNIYHIPKILYHWRCHDDSVAMSPEAKLYAFDRAVEVLQEHFDRIGRKVKVEKGDIYGSYKTSEI